MIRSEDVTPRSCATQHSRTTPAAAAVRRFLQLLCRENTESKVIQGGSRGTIQVRKLTYYFFVKRGFQQLDGCCLRASRCVFVSTMATGGEPEICDMFIRGRENRAKDTIFYNVEVTLLVLKMA